MPQQLAYAIPSVRTGRSALLPDVLFWLSTSFLGITLAVVILPVFGPYYIGSWMLPVAHAAAAMLFYGPLVSIAFTTFVLPVAWHFRRSGWRVRFSVCVAVAMAGFYLVLAPHDGAYARLLFGRC